MPLRVSAIWVLLLTAAVAPAMPASPAVTAEDCSGSSLPYVLDFGLPRRPDSPELRADRLQREIGRLIGDFYARHRAGAAGCPPPKLQVNITVASDYEILDWLSQGLLDAAVVPDLTVFLLTQRDEVPLQELEIGDHPVGGLLLPSLAARRLSGQLAGGRWLARSDPAADFRAFLEQAWRQADEPAPSPAAATGADSGTPAAPAGYRIVLASHLSTPGFLVPVAEAAQWVEERLGKVPEGLERERRAELFWQAFFDGARFAVDCDSTARVPAAGLRSCWRLPEMEERAGRGPVEILFPGEAVLRGERGSLAAAPVVTVPGPPDAATAPGAAIMATAAIDPTAAGSRERLVITARAAEPIFGPGLREARAELPAALDRLFRARPPLAALAPILDPEPSFGVRTFGFTVDEVFRLLRQDQSISGSRSLALVLPGGGVKAAYQSKVVDRLYQRGYLKNFQAAAAAGGEALDVEYVIGTSGGALLGYFVSQLGPGLPAAVETGEGLSEILWRKSDGRYLESTDIFGWTDLLRYVSVIVSFLVLCALLASVSIPERSPLNPQPKEGGGGYRRRLMSFLFLLLLVAPLLVRFVGGDSLQEQVPQFEGMVYAVLAMIAMFADQTLIHTGEKRTPGENWLPPALPPALGGVLVVVPLLFRAADDPFGFLREQVSFGVAFGVLAPLVLLGGLILPLRAGRVAAGRRGRRALALDFVLPAGLALALAWLLPDAWLDAIKMPFFLSGLLLVLVCVGANYFLGRHSRLGERARRFAYYGVLLLVALLLLVFCWPEAGAATRPDLGADALEITTGTFLLCIGLIVLMVGGVAWIFRRQRHYQLRAQRFLMAYFVALLHGVAVYVVLFAVVTLLPDWLSPLELTREFWLWLLGTSAVLGGILLLAALGRFGRAGKPRGPVVSYLRTSLELLCAHHPNGDFVTRRFLRLAALSVFCLFWWNLVLAPALYGNSIAQSYLVGAIGRFEAQAGFHGDGLHYRPTARFIAPANLLEKDGTRYFLFVPPGDDCPAIPNRAGARWLRFEARLASGAPGASGASGAAGTADGGCAPLANERLLRQAIFASGSPFPIFPAHRVPIDGVDKPLVDGGYSNNVPVDVALAVSAEQVLIVDSTNPLPSTVPPRSTMLSSLGSSVLAVRGKLVENLGRLPGFLFERSQQVDRLSRRDLFVVSLAPSRDELDWPPLFDFRRRTVRRMEEVAERDLTRRIGTVQSWGRPRFQLSVPVDAGAP